MFTSNGNDSSSEISLEKASVQFVFVGITESHSVCFENLLSQLQSIWFFQLFLARFQLTEPGFRDQTQICEKKF